MTMWEEKSLIDFDVEPAWTTMWDQGEVLILHVSAEGRVALAARPGDAGMGLALRSSFGVIHDPDRHFFVGCVEGVMVFAEMGEFTGQVDLRRALLEIGGEEVQVAFRSVSLVKFHATHTYCPQCGRMTRPADLGRARYCPRCEVELFPRTDPAVIVAITDDLDRLLLGHHDGWEDTRYSVFAGFVEAGESLEQTVRREVKEEVGIAVADIRYAGSQPWPMPRSLMVGFTARVASGDLRVDGHEITSARWFDRDQLRAGVAAGQVVLPLEASIAHRLIMGWLNRAV
ncbi:MAG: NAD(+) diphosphatase [Propionibacteriaceae bacterium]|nr:NAD(+) diphosphatase [Propionibacteriaceae bacterium]